MLVYVIAVIAIAIGAILLKIDGLDLGWKACLGAILACLGAAVVVVASIYVAQTHLMKEATYRNTMYQKSVLEYRLENQNLVGNELLYNDIVEFNNNLRTCKELSKNPFTNWFYNSKVAKIDYINIDGVSNPAVSDR